MGFSFCPKKLFFLKLNDLVITSINGTKNKQYDKKHYLYLSKDIYRRKKDGRTAMHEILVKNDEHLYKHHEDF